MNAITFWMFLVVALLCVAGWLLTEQIPPLSTFTPSLVGTVLFLAVMCTCVVMLVQNLGFGARSLFDRLVAALSRVALGRALLCAVGRRGAYRPSAVWFCADFPLGRALGNAFRISASKMMHVKWSVAYPL